MKNFLQWLKSPKSDFTLFVVLLILANLVCIRAFKRFDLTSPKSYSLSQASVRLVSTLEQPLSVKVFMSDNLPAPYNNVSQYVKDLLSEYSGKGNKNFSVQYFDMGKKESESMASGYGLRQSQIQQLSNNEVGFKQVWLGLVFSYADSIETLDGLTSTDGLEYKITSKMSSMISSVDTLAGLKGNITLTLYKSKKLGLAQIGGFDQIDQAVQEAFESVNKKNLGRLSYQVVDPSENEIQTVAQKYGLQALSWDNEVMGKGMGVLGLVLEHGENFRVVPLGITRTIFGNMVAGLDSLEEGIGDSLTSLVAKSREIGWITGHGELSFEDEQNGAGRLASLVSARYTFKNIDLTKEEIPAGMTSVVIDGPVYQFAEADLYKLDQFLMKGGNLILFLDPYKENVPEGQMAYYQQPTYDPIDTGLEKILSKYGVTPQKNYVLDENCYVQRSQQYGEMPIHFAPMMQKSSLSQKNVISKNLGYVIFIQAGSLDVTPTEGVKVTELAKSSPKSWLMTENITTNPSFISAPSDKSKEKAENLALLLEGNFTSAFDKAPAKDNGENEAKGDVAVNSHIAKSVQAGKIFIAGTSKVTGAQLLDEEGTQPVSLFISNVIDYMNGEDELCAMKTKGLSLTALNVKSGAGALIAKYFNQFGLVIIVIVIGLFVWAGRKARKAAIRRRYNPEDIRYDDESSNK